MEEHKQLNEQDHVEVYEPEQEYVKVKWPEPVHEKKVPEEIYMGMETMYDDMDNFNSNSDESSHAAAMAEAFSNIIPPMDMFPLSEIDSSEDDPNIKVVTLSSRNNIKLNTPKYKRQLLVKRKKKTRKAKTIDNINYDFFSNAPHADSESN